MNDREILDAFVKLHHDVCDRLAGRHHAGRYVDDPPDLHEFISRFGGYAAVTAEGWAEWDRLNAEWQQARRGGLRLKAKANKRRWSPQIPRGGGRHRLVILTGGRTNGELEMLGQRKSSGNFLPVMKYDARAGVIYTQDRVFRDREWQTEQRNVTEDMQAIFDLANVQVGWMLFPKGGPPQMVLKRPGEDIGERPSKDHKEGLRLIVNIIDDPAGPRELLSTSLALWRGIDELHDAYLAGLRANPDKLPVVVLADINEVKSQDNINYEPVFKIIKWVPRPADLPVNGIAPAEPKPKQSKPADKRGDMDSEIPF
jgi:hypothetical protein